MSAYRILAFLIVIGFVDCLPPGNITHTPRKIFRFPQNASTAVRTPSGGWARDKNSTSRIGVGEEQFVFPQDEDNDTPQPEVVNRAKFKPNIKDQAPPCAKGSTFCEKVDGYPGNALDNIFDNELDQYKELQGQDELKYVPPITQRIDINVTNEQPLCASIEEIVFPKLAKNKDDNWRYVVNTPSFEQGVRVEKCLKTSENEEQQCFFNDSFPNGYKTVCIQKYIYRRMVAVEDDGKPYKDVFPMPSCCSCAVISVGATFRQGVLRKALRSTTTPPPKH
uniref:Protein spaetzle n=1 Tax=Plautia stali TaxID=106108 RepID=A0A499U652_PLAST|nr:protein spaetzle [Plautia stali]